MPFTALDTSDEPEGDDLDHKPCDAAQAERSVTEINWRNKKRTLVIAPVATVIRVGCDFDLH